LFINLFITKNRLPNVFVDYCVLNRTVHSHVTRGNNDLHDTVTVRYNRYDTVRDIKLSSFGTDYLMY